MPGFVGVQNPRAGINLPAKNRIKSSFLVTVLDELGEPIGFITQWDESHTRAIQRQRHLNSDDAGRTLEFTVMPEEVTVTVGGFGLYKNPQKPNEASLIQRLIKNSTNANKLLKMLEEQQIPFSVAIEEVHPASANKEQDKDVTVFHECMIVDHRKPRNITSAFMAETATIQVGYTDDK